MPRKQLPDTPDIDDLQACIPESEVDLPGRTMQLSPSGKVQFARVFESAGLRMAEHVLFAMSVLDARRTKLQTVLDGGLSGRDEHGQRQDAFDDYMEAFLRLSKAADGMTRASTGAIHAAQSLRDDLPTARARQETRAIVAHIHYVPLAGATDYDQMIEAANVIAALPTAGEP